MKTIYKTGDRVRILSKKMYATVLVQRASTLLVQIDKQRYTDTNFYTEIPKNKCVIVAKSYIKSIAKMLKKTKRDVGANYKK